MNKFFRLFQHLLPNGIALNTTPNNRLRRFFLSLSSELNDVADTSNQNFLDLFPATTTKLNQWEKQFDLVGTGTEEERRLALLVAWRNMFGGHSPRYIQDTLHSLGFTNLFVHEWWEPIPNNIGGSINNDVTPVPRDPNKYIKQISEVEENINNGVGSIVQFVGGDRAFVGSSTIPSEKGYPLVNKIYEVKTVNSAQEGVDHNTMYIGNSTAVVTQNTSIFQFKEYQISPDAKHQFFMYIGAENFPDIATVDPAKKQQLERLCLSICPTQQWIGMLVKYE